jgi:hypothetical protein
MKFQLSMIAEGKVASFAGSGFCCGRAWMTANESATVAATTNNLLFIFTSETFRKINIPAAIGARKAI